MSYVYLIYSCMTIIILEAVGSAGIVRCTVTKHKQNPQNSTNKQGNMRDSEDDCANEKSKDDEKNNEGVCVSKVHF